MKTKDLLFYIFIAITYIKLDYLFLESETSMQNLRMHRDETRCYIFYAFVNLRSIQFVNINYK